MLTENQEKYLLKIPEDKKVHIIPYDPKTMDVVADIKKKIADAGIDLEVKHMGASALGISGQGDIDLYIFCLEKDYGAHVLPLENLFGPRISGISIYKWELSMGGFEIEIYLTDPATSNMQEQIKIFEKLKSDKKLLAEYESIKSSADGLSFREYMCRKYEFFNRVLSNKSQS